MVEKGDLDANKCRIIWKTPPYADYNWTAHPDLEKQFGAGFTNQLQSTLIGIEDPSLLSALPRDRLISARNEEYNGIRAIAKQLEMIR